MNEKRYREAERRLWESVGVTPTEQRVHLRQTGVTVRIQEVGQGPAVLFVHGASVSGACWAPLVARLDGFRCLILERPGCGLSDPLPYRLYDVERLEAFADTLIVDVLDAMGLDVADIVATSFGGYIALRTAAAHADRIGRMVAFSYVVGAPAVGVPLVMRLAMVPALGRLLAALPPNKQAVRAIFRGLGLGPALKDGRISEELLDWFLAMLRDTDTMSNELRSLPPVIYPLRGMNDRMLLPVSLRAGIHTPVSFLWGEEDPLGGAEVARAFVEHIPNAELELMPGAGHAVWLDDPDHAAKFARRALGG